MAARSADMFFFTRLFLLVTLIFCVKQKCFITEDGISITFLMDNAVKHRESFVYSSLFTTKKKNGFPKISLAIFVMLAGDIEVNPGPSLLDDNNKHCSTKGLKLFHLNIRSLHGKFDEIRDILLTCKKIDIFGLTETFLSDTEVNSFEIPGFTLITRNRLSGTGGGVCVYIRDGIDFELRDDLQCDEIEGVFIEILQKKSKQFIVSFLYKPPESSKHLSKNFDQILSQKLEIISRERKECIIIGDLNANYNNSSHQKVIKNNFITFGFDQLIKACTRITHESETLIDVILSNVPNNISRSTVITSGLSDHNIIACTRKMNNIKYQPSYISFRDFSNYDIDKVNNELLASSWESVYNATSPESAYNNFSSIILNVLNLNAPFISKRVKGKPSPWLTPEVKRSMNARDSKLRKAHKSEDESDWNQYRRLRNFVTNLINRAKRSFFKDQLSESKKNPNKFWKLIKQIFPVKHTTNVSLKSFTVNGVNISDKRSVANEFCTFFTNIASKLKCSAFPLKNLIWSFRGFSRSEEKFDFEPVLDTEVLKYLRNLKRNCATGLDNIPSCFLKDTAFVITKPLTYVINLSLNKGSLPNVLKKARVNPLHKSGSRKSFDNYRPISVLPVVSKIFEKCVYRQLIDYLESNNLLSNFQFGFRSRRSTEIAATVFTDHIRTAMDGGKYTGAIYVDLSKAFDTISHSILLKTLRDKGIAGNSLVWLTDYLFCRSQQVSYCGTISSPRSISCGVPQGSILGPLLFITYFNDAVKSITQSKVIMYADDTVIFHSHKDVKVIEENLNLDFNSLCDWLYQNELIVNFKKGKTELMIFGTQKKLCKLGENPVIISHNGNSVNPTVSYKYLGINLTPSLNITTHIKDNIKKASARVRLLQKTRYFMDKDTSKLLYQTLVLPLFTYCSLNIYGAIPNYLKERIVQIECRAERIIGCNIATCENVLIKRICSFVHRCIHKNNVCDVFDDYFKFKTSSINTRNNGKYLIIPRIRLEAARASFRFQGVKLFNSLPIKARMENDLNVFKKCF